MSRTAPSEYLIFSTSLRNVSFSRVMAETIRASYATLEVPHEVIDLRRYVLPLCDGEAAYEHPHVATLSGLIETARVIIIAGPVYNYDANAVAKNLVELTGSAWENKTVGFLCAAGGASSYMSIMGLANSLMLDFRCLIIPRFVYAKGDDFTAAKRATPALAERIEELARTSLKIRNAV